MRGEGSSFRKAPLCATPSHRRAAMKSEPEPATLKPSLSKYPTGLTKSSIKSYNCSTFVCEAEASCIDYIVQHCSNERFTASHSECSSSTCSLVRHEIPPGPKTADSPPSTEVLDYTPTELPPNEPNKRGSGEGQGSNQPTPAARSYEPHQL